MAQNRKIHVFRWISQLWSITEAKPGQTSKAMTKWHGTVVHLHVEKLQPRGHVHWRYRVPAAVSQVENFVRRIVILFLKFFFKKSKKIGLKLPESLKTNSELFSRRISNNFDQRFLGLENNINDI